jgi:hypothetical protein
MAQAKIGLLRIEHCSRVFFAAVDSVAAKLDDAVVGHGASNAPKLRAYQ